MLSIGEHHKHSLQKLILLIPRILNILVIIIRHEIILFAGKIFPITVKSLWWYHLVRALLHRIRVDLFVRIAFSTAGFQITPRLRHAFTVLFAFYKRLCGHQAGNYHQSLCVPLNFPRTQRDALEMTEQSLLTKEIP